MVISSEREVEQSQNAPSVNPVVRLWQATGMLCCVLLVLLAMAPYNTGEFPFFLTSGMLYNRVGYALVGIVLVEALLPPREAHKLRVEWWGGAATGLLLAFLLFFKITY